MSRLWGSFASSASLSSDRKAIEHNENSDVKFQFSKLKKSASTTKTKALKALEALFEDAEAVSQADAVSALQWWELAWKRLALDRDRGVREAGM
jgi:HPt (histidine-containing phosphotransfer) domain-containing protein